METKITSFSKDKKRAQVVLHDEVNGKKISLTVHLKKDGEFYVPIGKRDVGRGQMFATAEAQKTAEQVYLGMLTNVPKKLKL